MELVNREDNYNRIFADQQPILIDQTTIKLVSTRLLHPITATNNASNMCFSNVKTVINHHLTIMNILTLSSY